MIIAFVIEPQAKGNIEEVARNESIDYLILADEKALATAFQKEMPEVLFLEIGSTLSDGAELIQKLKRAKSTQKIPIVAFGNSLRADLLQDAREAGADLVLPKAAFREKLPELIRHYAKASEKSERSGHK